MRLIFDRSEGMVRCGFVRDNRIEGLSFDPVAAPSLVGSIHQARVDRIMPQADAAYVLIEDGRACWLAAKEIRPRPAKGKNIGETLSPGKRLTIQIKADPPPDKDPRATMEIAFAGRFLIRLADGSGKVMLSSRINRKSLSEDFQALIEDLRATGGDYILRQSAARARVDDVLHEANALQSPAPIPGFVRTCLTDVDTIEEIAIADPSLYQQIESWAAWEVPGLLPVIMQKDICAELDEAQAEATTATVPLPGGGRLHIETTRALTAIDIDSGDRQSPQDANMAAAREIPRQIRLRNLSGQILIDAIDMRNKAAIRRVTDTLTKHLKGDPARTDVLGVSHLGLIEMTRERRLRPLSEMIPNR